MTLQKQSKMKRVWRSFDTWEEIGANMWGEVEDRKGMLAKAIAFTGDHVLYGSFMRRVISEWPNSCENALTDLNMNRKAWIGHAACALALGCPEDITRKAWGFLSDEQRILANTEAASAIQAWENGYIKSGRICKSVAVQMLFEWDTGRSAKRRGEIGEGAVIPGGGDCPSQQ